MLAHALGFAPEPTRATVVRTGDKIILPEGARIPEVIASLERQHTREEQLTEISVTIPVPPWDGAMALQQAIKDHLGFANQQEGFFGGANQITVEVGLNTTVQIPWGSFELQGMEGASVSMDTDEVDDQLVFKVYVRCKRKYEDRVRGLLDLVRKIATEKSLHRGKAFSMEFTDSDGDHLDLPSPKFFSLDAAIPLFNEKLTAAIDRNVFVPIRHAQALAQAGESLKQGILFAGGFGVGKTLLASYIAKVATQHGWTFIYVKDARELPAALRFARHYEPVIVFAEDIDRVAGAERTDEVNELMNELDGVDSKTAQIMTIVTTNYPDRINAGMMRPGRIDLLLEVEKPDANTVLKMIHAFAGDTLDAGIDCTPAATKLAGQIPARVREAVSRAKRAMLQRTSDMNGKVIGSDLEAVANEVIAEGKLFQQQGETNHHSAAFVAEWMETSARSLRRLGNGQLTPVVQ